MQSRRITICVCASRPYIDKEKAARTAAVLSKEGCEVTVLADLCRVAVTDKAAMKAISSSTVIACHRRAIRSMFDAVGGELPESLDLREGDTAAIFGELGIAGQSSDPGVYEKFIGEIEEFGIEQGTDAWYPVIDRERCTECGKCFDFCLFGVYALEEGRVAVRNPGNCKNNCPACARTCPGKAIIFPKYDRSPINGGVEEGEENLAVDTKALYNETLRMRLKERRAGVQLLNKDKL